MADTATAIADLAATVEAMRTDLDSFWLLFGACLVFFMQTGFAMLEVGSVSVKNTKNILIKNLFDAVIGSLCWWAFGMALALGETENGFIGTSGFFMKEGYVDEDALALNGYAYCMWLFQWAFAATCATIVSGAIAERVTFGGYVAYSIILTVIVYPPMVCSGWNSQGWASAWREEDLLFGCGMIDFAGSGVVHMTGGIAAVIAAKTIGPRIGRFAPDGTPCDLPQQSAVLQSLGTLILWLGWFGFNGVSTLYIIGYSGVAGKVCCNTTLAGAACSIGVVTFGKLREHLYDPGLAQNGLLAGLVAITAGCSVVEPEGAIIIGILASPIYYFGSKLLIKLQIDDVVDATPVHCFNGAWGIIAAGLFATETNYSNAYYSARAADCQGLFYGGNGSSLGAALAFFAVDVAWTGLLAVILFVGIKKTIGLRVGAEMEMAGMDISKHGGITYPEMQLNLKKQASKEVTEIQSENIPSGNGWV